MRKLISTTLAIGAAMLAAVHPLTAAGQPGGLDRRLAAAKRLECTFSVFATGTWDGGKPSAAVAPTERTAVFFDINIDEGTAEADSSYGASFISVRYAQGYLHFMQVSDSGPMYLTTVMARQTGENRLMAVHVRIDYSPTVLPGFTSRPEMYVGSCAIAN
jgi:hypothetical protein